MCVQKGVGELDEGKNGVLLREGQKGWTSHGADPLHTDPEHFSRLSELQYLIEMKSRMTVESSKGQKHLHEAGSS